LNEADNLSQEPHVTVLFDCDGVVIDTEDQYSVMWKKVNEEHLPEQPGMYLQIKGMTAQAVFRQYFSGKPEVQATIEKFIEEFEAQMTYEYVPGVLNFIHKLRLLGIKTALVTSSSKEKMSRVAAAHPEFRGLFDAMVTGDDVSKGKPEPECYLKAATILNVPVQSAVVFEDSFMGIQAGRTAGMRVVGVSTTNSAESLKGKCHEIIPDFSDFSYEKLIAVHY
jgi:HAD superfamily hydrolase (TIGR01509 family)